jgi:hypothetical protein
VSLAWSIAHQEWNVFDTTSAKLAAKLTIRRQISPVRACGSILPIQSFSEDAMIFIRALLPIAMVEVAERQICRTMHRSSWLPEVQAVEAEVVMAVQVATVPHKVVHTRQALHPKEVRPTHLPPMAVEDEAMREVAMDFTIRVRATPVSLF